MRRIAAVLAFVFASFSDAAADVAAPTPMPRAAGIGLGLPAVQSAYPTPAPRPSPLTLAPVRIVTAGQGASTSASGDVRPAPRREGEEENIYGDDTRESLAARERRAAEWDRLARTWLANRRTRTVRLQHPTR